MKDTKPIPNGEHNSSADSGIFGASFSQLPGLSLFPITPRHRSGGLSVWLHQLPSQDSAPLLAEVSGKQKRLLLAFRWNGNWPQISKIHDSFLHFSVCLKISITKKFSQSIRKCLVLRKVLRTEL